MPGRGLRSLMVIGSHDIYYRQEPSNNFTRDYIYTNIQNQNKVFFKFECPPIPIPIIEQPKIQVRNLYLTVDFIKNIITILKQHQYILSYKPINTPILKNTECPITLNEITDLYLECSTCKMCYDYNTTIHYFKNKSTCSHCRQNIDIKTLSQTHSSQIYLMLKNYDYYCLL